MRRATAALLALVLCIDALPVAALGADGLAYIDQNGNTATYAGSYTQVTSNTIQLSDGWYLVQGDVQINQEINVTGNVTLVLGDNATLTARWVKVAADGNFTITSQSLGEDMGQFNINSSHYRGCIVSSNSGGPMTVSINGGYLYMSTSYGNNLIYSYDRTDSELNLNGGVIESSLRDTGDGPLFGVENTHVRRITLCITLPDDEQDFAYFYDDVVSDSGDPLYPMEFRGESSLIIDGFSYCLPQGEGSIGTVYLTEKEHTLQTGDYSGKLHYNAGNGTFYRYITPTAFELTREDQPLQQEDFGYGVLDNQLCFFESGDYVLAGDGT